LVLLSPIEAGRGDPPYRALQPLDFPRKALSDSSRESVLRP